MLYIIHDNEKYINHSYIIKVSTYIADSRRIETEIKKIYLTDNMIDDIDNIIGRYITSLYRNFSIRNNKPLICCVSAVVFKGVISIGKQDYIVSV